VVRECAASPRVGASSMQICAESARSIPQFTLSTLCKLSVGRPPAGRPMVDERPHRRHRSL